MKKMYAGLLLLSSFIANTAFAYYKVATVANATACHVNNAGQHHLGRDTEVYGFTDDGKEFPLYLGQTGDFPIMVDDDNFRLYAVVDNGYAADRWIIDYTPGDNYIVSDDSGTGTCTLYLYQCIKFTKMNPCAS
jgi:hypothetical protein